MLSWAVCFIFYFFIFTFVICRGAGYRCWQEQCCKPIQEASNLWASFFRAPHEEFLSLHKEAFSQGNGLNTQSTQIRFPARNFTKAEWDYFRKSVFLLSWARPSQLPWGKRIRVWFCMHLGLPSFIPRAVAGLQFYTLHCMFDWWCQRRNADPPWGTLGQWEMPLSLRHPRAPREKGEEIGMKDRRWEASTLPSESS